MEARKALTWALTIARAELAEKRPQLIEEGVADGLLSEIRENLKLAYLTVSYVEKEATVIGCNVGQEDLMGLRLKVKQVTGEMPGGRVTVIVSLKGTKFEKAGGTILYLDQLDFRDPKDIENEQ